MKIGMWSECIQLSHQHLIQCPAHYRFAIKICRINEWASDSCRYWPAECFHMILPIQIRLVSFSFLFISTSTILALATGSPYLETAGWLSYLQLLLFSYYSPHLCTVVFLMCRSVQDTALRSAMASIALRIKFKLSNETMWDRLDLPPVSSWASPLHMPPFLTSTFFLCSEGNCPPLRASHKVMSSSFLCTWCSLGWEHSDFTWLTPVSFSDLCSSRNSSWTPSLYKVLLQSSF